MLRKVSPTNIPPQNPLIPNPNLKANIAPKGVDTP